MGATQGSGCQAGSHILGDRTLGGSISRTSSDERRSAPDGGASRLGKTVVGRLSVNKLTDAEKSGCSGATDRGQRSPFLYPMVSLAVPIPTMRHWLRGRSLTLDIHLTLLKRPVISRRVSLTCINRLKRKHRLHS